MVSALSYALESKKISHGNLKPENVFLSQNAKNEDIFLLTDLGLCELGSQYKKVKSSWEGKQRLYLAPETLNEQFDFNTLSGEKIDCY